jgi:hypothetical protein
MLQPAGKVAISTSAPVAILSLLSVVLFVCVAQCSMTGPLKLAASTLGVAGVPAAVADGAFEAGPGLLDPEHPTTWVLISAVTASHTATLLGSLPMGVIGRGY